MREMFYYPAPLRWAGNVARQEQLPEHVQELSDSLDPFFFGAEVSSSRLDSYYSQMDLSSLKNYAQAGRDGVSFLDSHDYRKMGIGMSTDGLLIEGDPHRVELDFYTVPGITFGGQHSYQSTDDFIRALESRLARDVSVGIYGGKELCQICQSPVWGRTDCIHFPGETYEVDEAQVLATSVIYDAQLAEVSIVFDGATPGAMITKFEQELSAGRLDPGQLGQMATRYRTAGLPEYQKSWQVKLPAERSKPMNETIRDLTELLGCEVDDLLAVVTDLYQGQSELVREVARLEQKNKELAPLAADGKTYKADLIEQALAEGVRALGNDFDEPTYRETLEGSTITVIKLFTAGWANAASKRWPTDGAQVNGEGGPNEPAGQEIETIPDRAYQA